MWKLILSVGLLFVSMAGCQSSPTATPDSRDSVDLSKQCDTFKAKWREGVMQALAVNTSINEKKFKKAESQSTSAKVLLEESKTFCTCKSDSLECMGRWSGMMARLLMYRTEIFLELENSTQARKEATDAAEYEEAAQKLDAGHISEPGVYYLLGVACVREATPECTRGALKKLIAIDTKQSLEYGHDLSQRMK